MEGSFGTTLNGIKIIDMIRKEDLKKMLYLDVETSCITESLEILRQENPRLASLWTRRCKYYRTYPEYQELSDDEIFLQKASLEPEFARVVCVSFGVFSDSDSDYRMMSFYGSDEKEILTKTNKILNNAHIKSWKLCGHNIKGFDVPCLGKRMLFNDIEPSPNIQVWDKKPWEIPFLDTSEIFSFGSWVQQKYLSLDLLSCSMGIASPKDDMDGSQVNSAYWEGRIKEISEYCEKDVRTVISVLEKIAYR